MDRLFGVLPRIGSISIQLIKGVALQTDFVTRLLANFFIPKCQHPFLFYDTKQSNIFHLIVLFRDFERFYINYANVGKSKLKKNLLLI